MTWLSDDLSRHLNKKTFDQVPSKANFECCVYFYSSSSTKIFCSQLIPKEHSNITLEVGIVIYSVIHRNNKSKYRLRHLNLAGDVRSDALTIKNLKQLLKEHSRKRSTHFDACITVPLCWRTSLGSGSQAVYIPQSTWFTNLHTSIYNNFPWAALQQSSPGYLPASPVSSACNKHQVCKHTQLLCVCTKNLLFSQRSEVCIHLPYLNHSDLNESKFSVTRSTTYLLPA